MPGPLEPGPLSLPKTTVPPRRICYELKNYPQSREPNVLLEDIHHYSTHTHAHGSWHCPSCTPALGMAEPPKFSVPGGRQGCACLKVTPPLSDKLLFATDPVLYLQNIKIPSERFMLNASRRLKTEYGTMTHSIQTC